VQLKRVSRDAIEQIKIQCTRLGKVLTVESYPEDAAAILAGPDAAPASDDPSQPAHHDQTYLAAIERWSAALALRLLRLDSLALRVKGVTDLRDLVEQVRKI
jgi:hypothetical protein